MAGRERWGSRMAFIMAAVGSAVGLGNVWRFPFIAYKHGGGAFFIPYIVALLTAGIPVMMLEYALGMKNQCGAPKALGSISKRFKWVGWLAVLVALSITFYYVAIMAYSWRYMFASADRDWEQPTSNQTVFKVPYLLVDSEEDAEELRTEILAFKKAKMEADEDGTTPPRLSEHFRSRGVSDDSENFLIAQVVVRGEFVEFKEERLERWGLEPGQEMSPEQVQAYAKDYYEKGLHETRFEDVKSRVLIVPYAEADQLNEGLADYYGGVIQKIRDGPDKKAELRIPEERVIRTITLDQNMKLFRNEIALGGFYAGKWVRQGTKNKKLEESIEELEQGNTDFAALDSDFLAGNEKKELLPLSEETRRLYGVLAAARAESRSLPAADKEALASLLATYHEDNTSEMFSIDWTLVFWAFVTWLIIFLIIFKGVGVVGKVVMITVPLPIICLGILIVHGLTLDGAGQGINFLLTPDWDKILDAEVWFAAYGQIFFSLSLGFGILIAYASYLPKDSDVSNNAFMTSFCNCATSFYASFAVFSVLGYLATSLNVPPDEVVQAGPGLVFVTYPVALTEMGGTIASVVGILFFLSLLSLGIDSAFSIAEAVVAGIHDYTKAISKTAITAILCSVGFLITVFPYCLSSGLMWLDINDNWMGNYGLVLVGLLECIAVAYFYKVEKLREFINERSEIQIHVWWDIFIKVITPVILVYLFVNQITTNLMSTYEGYDIISEHSVTVWGWGYFALLFVIAFLVGQNYMGFVGILGVAIFAAVLNLAGVTLGGAVMAGITFMLLFGGFFACLRIAMEKSREKAGG